MDKPITKDTPAYRIYSAMDENTLRDLAWTLLNRYFKPNQLFWLAIRVQQRIEAGFGEVSITIKAGNLEHLVVTETSKMNNLPDPTSVDVL